MIYDPDAADGRWRNTDDTRARATGRVAMLLEELLDMEIRGHMPLNSRALPRLLTALEADPMATVALYRAAQWLGVDTQRLYPRFVIGITGTPGAGKSSLTSALIQWYRRRMPEVNLGVLAVDPSSPRAGGALLGDRVRMMDHAQDPQVFIRSMGSRGLVGGLSLGVRAAMHALALAGCQRVIIETVGAGQDEVEIASVADLVALVMAPDHGDSVQLLKAGLMEVGDLFVVNKADVPSADTLYSQLLSVLALDQQASDQQDNAPGHAAQACHDDVSPVAEAQAKRACLVSCRDRRGLSALFEQLEDELARRMRDWPGLRDQQMRDEVAQAVLAHARAKLTHTLQTDERWPQRIEAILGGELSGASAATMLLTEAAACRGDAPGTRDCECEAF